MKKINFALAVLPLLLLAGCAQAYDSLLETVYPSLKASSSTDTGTPNATYSINIATPFNIDSNLIYITRTGSFKAVTTIEYALTRKSDGAAITGNGYGGYPWGALPGGDTTGTELPVMVDFSSLSIYGTGLPINSSTTSSSSPFAARVAVQLVYSDGKTTKLPAVDINLYSTSPSASTRYSIDYFLDGGSFADGAYATSYIAGAGTSLNSPTKAGYTFGGWYGDSSFKASVTSIPATASGAIQLYAKWNAIAAPTGNYALNSAVTSSGNETSLYQGANAVDGNLASRWASQRSLSAANPAWIALDLGATRSFTGVAIKWEAAPSGTFAIQYSADGSNWINASATLTASTNSTTSFPFGFNCRYLRIYATGTQGTAGVSIYEIAAY